MPSVFSTSAISTPSSTSLAKISLPTSSSPTLPINFVLAPSLARETKAVATCPPPSTKNLLAAILLFFRGCLSTKAR